jgi:hypothetical protein
VGRLNLVGHSIAITNPRSRPIAIIRKKEGGMTLVIMGKKKD